MQRPEDLFLLMSHENELYWLYALAGTILWSLIHLSCRPAHFLQARSTTRERPRPSPQRWFRMPRGIKAETNEICNIFRNAFRFSNAHEISEHGNETGGARADNN